MNEEKWKPVVGYNNYLISDHGRITIKCDGSKFLKMVECRKGHFQLGLYRNGIEKKHYAHRLVLEAFIGPCPEGFEGSHLDGDPANNKLENLIWESPKDNQARRVEHGTHSRGERHGNAKLNEIKVKQIRKIYPILNMCNLATLFRVKKETIRDVISRKTWRHV